MPEIRGKITFPNDSGEALDELGIRQVDPPQRGAVRYQPGSAGAVPYATFQGRHPEYRERTWRNCRAFYKGGAALLENREVMEDVFPRHMAERPRVYEERCRRAFYINYPGPIIDWFCSAVASDPIKVGVATEDSDDEGEESFELPEPYWADFFADVSRPGGEECSFQQFLIEQQRAAFQARFCWALVDLPEVPDDAPPPANLDEQVKAGELDAYLVHVEPEEVIDWEADAAGELLWAIRRTCERPRTNWQGRRNVTVERFTVYERDRWTQFEIRYDDDHKPTVETPVPKVAEGPLAFGVVPLIRYTLPEGLWAMGKLESPARAHFNKRNALDWAEHKSLLPILYEFLGPEDGSATTESAMANDPARPVAQPRGQSTVQIRGKEDKAMYVGPDPGPFGAALTSCHDLRDELHRVTHQMALAVNNTGAALSRSAESKGEDKSDRSVVLEEIGRLLRAHALRIVGIVSRVRQTGEAPTWKARGFEKFDLDSLGELIDQAVNLSTISIPSPTFQRLHLLDVCAKRLGEKATAEVMERIDEELGQALTMETLMPPGPGEGEPPGEDAEDEDDPEGEDVPPPRRAPPAGGGPRAAFATSGMKKG